MTILSIIIVVCVLLIGYLFISKFSIRKANKESFKHYMSGPGMPIIKLSQNNKEFNFIIDTGSNYSVLNAKWLKDFTYRKLIGSGNVEGIGGPQEASYVEVIFEQSGKTYNDVFQVLDVPLLDAIGEEANIEIAGLLGNSFLSKYDVKLDYSNYTTSFLSNGRKNKA